MSRRALKGFRVRPFSQRYISYQLGERFLRLPLLHVRLIGNTDKFRTIALVDSGATVSFVPLELAEAVSLPIVRRDVSAVGAGGEFPNDVCEFRVEVLIKDEIVHRIRGEAYVPKERGRIPYVVLGRDYLFGDYDITFREHEQKVSLRPATGR